MIIENEQALAAGEASLAKALRLLSEPGRPADVARARLRTLVEAVGEDVPADLADRALLSAVVTRVGVDPDRLWLAYAVLAARLPTLDRMETLARTARLDGTWTALMPVLRSIWRAEQHPEVEVVTGAITCDIHHTAGTDYVSGIQRVVRETVTRWEADHDVRFIGWTSDRRALCDLDDERHRRIFGTPSPRGGGEGAPQTVVVPWRGTHLLPELAAEAERTERMGALATHSGCEVGIIGYDCIPMTTPSSVTPGMVGAFLRYLASMREVARIAAISPAAADEFEGWRRMLAGIGADGPAVSSVTLPVTAKEPSEEALGRARRSLGTTSAPMVLVIGSHEPRKNHLAILHAAELLWREGLQFTLSIVGAGSWKAEAFNAAIAELNGVGRPVLSVRGLPDDQLWAGLRLAHCTLFPSLNEGFGLPVAESLAAGTPVITSDFGSTRDIVAPDGVALGGLLVDPRDDHAIADALRTMLTDPATYARLRAETAQHEPGSWDAYARDVWDFLVEGR